MKVIDSYVKWDEETGFARYSKLEDGSIMGESIEEEEYLREKW